MVYKTWEGKVIKPGKPDAMKVACPVWEGMIGNVITTVRMWITRAGHLLHRQAGRDGKSHESEHDRFPSQALTAKATEGASEPS